MRWRDGAQIGPWSVVMMLRPGFRCFEFKQSPLVQSLLLDCVFACVLRF